MKNWLTSVKACSEQYFAMNVFLDVPMERSQYERHSILNHDRVGMFEHVNN